MTLAFDADETHITTPVTAPVTRLSHCLTVDSSSSSSNNNMVS
ncbi:hypothetical protein FHG87_019463 [Trinorchestia longiramus]|nr:hypothetical protein FHG87_019463 [Trinorchestia longiramus]